MSCSSPFKEDQKTSHVTKIILVAWLVILCWNSGNIFDPITRVTVDPTGVTTAAEPHPTSSETP